jgi:hypothetical protein
VAVQIAARQSLAQLSAEKEVRRRPNNVSRTVVFTTIRRNPDDVVIGPKQASDSFRHQQVIVRDPQAPILNPVSLNADRSGASST